MDKTNSASATKVSDAEKSQQTYVTSKDAFSDQN
jgi:hypothetical protein